MNGIRLIFCLCCLAGLSVACNASKTSEPVAGSEEIRSPASPALETDTAATARAKAKQASRSELAQKKSQPASIETRAPAAAKDNKKQPADAPGVGGPVTAEREEFWPDGSLRKQWIVKMRADGTEVEHGPWRRWHENGQLYLVGEYEDGKRNGEWLSWHLNGEKRGQGTFRRDFRIGPWTMWYDSGQKRGVSNHDRGLLHGRATKWDEQGNVLETGEYFRNKKHGVWESFSGDTKTEITWERGEIVP